MKKDGKGFSTKDVIMIVLCVLVLIVLILLLKQSGKNQKEEQAQLNQMQEEITKTGETGSSVSGKNSSYVVCNEVNQEGWLELYNAGKQEIHMQEAAIYVNGELVKTYKDEFSIPARSLGVLEAGVKLGQEENNVISLVNGEEKLNLSMVSDEIKSKTMSCLWWCYETAVHWIKTLQMRYQLEDIRTKGDISSRIV